MASLCSFTLPKPTFSFIIKSSSSSTSTVTSSPPPAVSSPESLQDRFGRKGIKFSESNGIPFAELTVRNGSSLKLQIPNAHVTSYKPKVYWKDDGFEELLYTLPATTGSDSSQSRGGVGLIVNQEKATSKSTPTSEWIVKDVDSDAIDALQVELSCKSGSLDINYVVSLYPLSMATAVKVQNNGRKPVNITSAILTHFISKRRSGAAIQWLEGCSYCSHPPLPSPFELLSPFEAMKTESPGWFFAPEPEKKVGEWTSQDVPFTILGHKLSRVYAAHPSERSKPFYRTPPSKYEYIDQGRELFFRIIRMGYEDIYVSGPGSYSDKFGKDYFICTGPASMLVPVVVNPGEEWRGNVSAKI
ncbi:hypothetical protein QQ045_024234 [Rhodiola kirilowii]